MKRPLWVTGIAFSAALLLANLLGLGAALWMAVLCLVLCLGAQLFPLLRARREITGALLAAMVGFGLFSVKEGAAVRPLEAFDGTTHTVEAQVVETQEGSCVVRVTAGDVPAGTRIKLWLSADKLTPALYDNIRAEVQLSLPDKNRLSLKAEDIYLTGLCTGYGEQAMSVTAPDSRPWYAVLDTWRERFSQTIRRLLPGEEGALVTAVCLGDKSGLSLDTTEAFRRAGLTHLLVVSGLHMTIIAQVVLWLLLALRVPRRAAAGAASLVLLLFMLLVGLSPSVVRAGVMSLVLLTGQIISRDADSLNSMGLALLLLTAGNPFVVMHVGLQLSFASTFGLVVLAPRLQRAVLEACRRRHARRTGGEEADWRPPRPFGWGISAVCVTLCAMLPTMPILALYFGELSVVSPLANLLGVFPANALLVVGCLTMLLDLVPFMGWAVRGLALLAGLLARYLRGMTGVIGSWGAATVPLTEPYWLIWLIGSLGLLWLGYRMFGAKGVRRALAMSVVVLACGLGLHTALWRGVTTITSIDAGDNTALLIEQDGHAGLVATGDSRKLLDTVWYALRRRGIRHLDFLLLPDMEGRGASQVREFTGRIEVDALLYPGDGVNAPLADAADAGVREVYDDTDSFTFWNTGYLAFEKGGWVRIELQQTRVLLCPNGGDAAALPADWRRADLVVFTETPPIHAAAITAQSGVLNCSDYTLPETVETLPWGLYPMRLTAVDGDVQAATRGQGDLTVRG